METFDVSEKNRVPRGPERTSVAISLSFWDAISLSSRNGRLRNSFASFLATRIHPAPLSKRPVRRDDGDQTKFQIAGDQL